MHPLEGSYSFSLGKPYAVIQVTRKGKSLHIEPGVSIARSDVLFTELPHDYTIIDSKGNNVKPSGIFIISAETIDPFHLVADWKKT